MEINLSSIKNIILEGIDHEDYPKYCDAFISYGDINGIPLTKKELKYINENERSFISEKACEYLHESSLHIGSLRKF